MYVLVHVDRKSLGFEHLPSQVFQIKVEVGTFSDILKVSLLLGRSFVSHRARFINVERLQDNSFSPSVLRLIDPRSLIQRTFELLYLLSASSATRLMLLFFFSNLDPLQILFAYIHAEIL